MADDVAFALPSLGADMEKARVARWLKAPGDAIHRGEAIVQVETDKGLIDVECFDDATFDAALVAEGSEIAVGTPIARLRVDGASARPPPAPTIPADAPVAPSATPEPAPESSTPNERVYATPLARRRAEALHIDLHGVVPADGHRICLEDVLRAAHPPEPSSTVDAPPSTASTPLTPATAKPPPALPTTSKPSTSSPSPSPAEASKQPTSTRDPRAAMRHAIAAAMSRSKRDIPHYYLWHTIDAGPLLAWLDAANARRSVTDRLLLAAPLVRAVALAAAEFPEMNGRCLDDGFVAADEVNVCFATSLRGGGLIAPAIDDADHLDVDATMRAIAGLVQRVRGGGLTARELSSGTITVTSLGDLGVQGLLPVIQPPQVAIVGFGAVFDRVVVDDGQPRVGRAITVTVAGDHRVSDGQRGARFLHAVAHRLLHPEEP